MRPDLRKRGITIIELLIAAVITVALSAGIFSIMNTARNTVGLTQAKEEAKQMAEMALAHLQKDIAASHATIDKNDIVDGKPKATLTFEDKGGGKWFMEVPKTEDAEAMADDYVDLEYSLEGTKLYRDGGIEGKKMLVASKISKLEIFTLSAEQVSIEIETSVIPPSHKTPVTHNQKALVTIREAVAVNVDDRWRTSDEVITEY